MDKLSALIAKDFQIETHESEGYTEDEVLLWLADHVAYMLEYRMEFLMSLMYRLDIKEVEVSTALSPVHPEAANIALARLVLDRQKERIFTKQFYKQADLDDIEEELRW